MQWIQIKLIKTHNIEEHGKNNIFKYPLINVTKFFKDDMNNFFIEQQIVIFERYFWITFKICFS